MSERGSIDPAAGSIDGSRRSTAWTTRRRPRPPPKARPPTGTGEIVDAEVVGVTTQDDEAEEEEAGGRRRRALLDWVVVIGVALLVAFLVRTFVLAHFVVDGTSMFSTLHDDDRVFVNKLSYRLHDPNRGDVVVLHQITGGVRARPDQAGHRPARRDDRDPQLPGAHRRPGPRGAVPRPEVVTPGNCGGELAPQTVPEDHVFVMGDNRGGSQDSRALGPIDEDDLVGGRSSCSGPSPTGRLAPVGLVGGSAGSAGLPSSASEGVDHHVDVVAVDAVDAHPQGRAEDVLVLHVPPEATRSKRWNSVVSPPSSRCGAG